MIRLAAAVPPCPPAHTGYTGSTVFWVGVVCLIVGAVAVLLFPAVQDAWYRGTAWARYLAHLFLLACGVAALAGIILAHFAFHAF